MISQENRRWIRVLYLFGVNKSALARLFKCQRNTIQYITNPARADVKRRKAREQGRRNYCPIKEKRLRVRKSARIEAMELGIPAEQIYQQWGVQ